MNAPVLTVVVLSRHRPLRLRWLRNALRATDGPEILESRCFPDVGAAVRAAGASRVALLDEDLLPAPGWVARAGAGDGRLVQGAVRVDPQQIIVLDNAPHLVAARVDPPRVWAGAVNVVGSRDTLAALTDGLGERALAAMLHARARRTGVAVAGDPELLAWSSVERPTVRSGAAAAVRRHPELRQELVFGVFTRRGHLRLALAAAGVLLGPRAALLLAPWALHRQPGDGGGAKGAVKAALRLPSRTARDGRTLARAVAESVRERTLVL
jgi:hypothetical protein